MKVSAPPLMQRVLPTLVFLLVVSGVVASAQSTAPPRLEKRGGATQLIVDGKPFLMLAGELGNSSSSSLNYMRPIWPRLASMSLNTVLTPISWELVEPTEGKYDFTLVDGLLAQAREQHLRIVFLWFGSWKNGMSSYPPVWVKQDVKRFPRVVQKDKEVEVLTPLSAITQDADARAFAEVMKHLRDVDAREHTVLMMQVENEVGVLGDSRDRSLEAERAFASAVPGELLKYASAHRETLDPDFRELWDKQGAKTSGTWTQVFGEGQRADEIFMAWHYARFVNAVAAKGKAAYNIPMYANAWLAENNAAPGDYPSGGPQPRVLDVWKAASSAIDLCAPDLYAPDFSGFSNRYHRADNPLFIPETRNGAPGAANVFYAVGEHFALGFSPFGIDFSFPGEPPAEPSAGGRRGPKPPELSASYNVLAQIWPAVAEAQSKGTVHGFVLDKAHPSEEFTMNGYVVQVSLDQIFGFHAENGFGMILSAGPDAFLGAGRGFRVAFKSIASPATQVGIGSVDEGDFVNDNWVAGRRLNGDENDQGRYWRFDQFQTRIEKVTVYRSRQ